MVTETQIKRRAFTVLLESVSEYQNWNDKEIQQSKVKGTVRIVCILNKYSLTNKRVLRLMRIWERVRIENEMQLLVEELRRIEDQFNVVTLLHLNQYCKDRMQSVFYTWLANCSLPDVSRQNHRRFMSQNSSK